MACMLAAANRARARSQAAAVSGLRLMIAVSCAPHPWTEPERPTITWRHAWFSPNSDSASRASAIRSEEHTSELQSLRHLVCRLLLEKKIHHSQKDCQTTSPGVPNTNRPYLNGH